MSTQSLLAESRVEDPSWAEALQWAGALFIASFKSRETRRAYQGDLHCWFAFCAVHDLHPFRGVRRTHLEIYLRQMEGHDPVSNDT